MPQPQERPRSVPGLLSRVQVPSRKCKARSLSSPSHAPWGLVQGLAHSWPSGEQSLHCRVGTAPHTTEKPERAGFKGKGQDQREIN